MAGSLEGPLAKFLRAERQMHVLNDEILHAWLPTKRWPVRTEVNRGGLEYRFYLCDEVPIVERDWPLLAGEVMFNMRAALDHLAYELHVRRWPRAKPSKFEEVSAFPLCSYENRFIGKGRKPRGYPSSIALLGSRDRSAIKHLQPYVARRDKWYWVRHGLGLLDTLHNIDKHRKLHLVAASQGSADIPEFPSGVGFHMEPIWGPVHPGAHVETWTFAKPPAKMRHHGGALLEVGLQHGDQWPRVIPVLATMLDATANVLRRFADRFPQAPLDPESSFGEDFWAGRV